MNRNDIFDFSRFDPADPEPVSPRTEQNGMEEPASPPEIHTSLFEKLAQQVPGFVSVSSNLESGTCPCRVSLDTEEWGSQTLRVLSSQGLLFEVHETKLMGVLDIRLVGAPEKDGVVDPFGKILFAIPIETPDLYEFLVRLNQWSTAWITIFGRFEPPRTSLNVRGR